MFLTPADLQRITGCVRFRAQARALDRLGIRYILSAKGEPLVKQDALDGKSRPGRNAIRWDRVNA